MAQYLTRNMSELTESHFQLPFQVTPQLFVTLRKVKVQMDRSHLLRGMYPPSPLYSFTLRALEMSGL